MPSWNQRNAQRATVKRPGTKEYSADYQSKNKQLSKGGDGRLFVRCAHCGKESFRAEMRPTQDRMHFVLAVICRNCGKDQHWHTV